MCKKPIKNLEKNRLEGFSKIFSSMYVPNLKAISLFVWAWACTQTDALNFVCVLHLQYKIIITSITRLPLRIMEVLFSVKIFDIEFSPDLHILRFPECKNGDFENWSVRMRVHVYICVCVAIRGTFITFKTKYYGSAKFYTRYQKNVWDLLVCKFYIIDDSRVQKKFIMKFLFCHKFHHAPVAR